MCLSVGAELDTEVKRIGLASSVVFYFRTGTMVHLWFPYTLLFSTDSSSQQ